ncbi:MAG: TOBE domain-containing protein [Candidatus Bipolaricaulota bacterium]
MGENRSEFGNRVRQAREDTGIGLRELARNVDMDYSNLSRIERGQRPPPDLETVIRIAKELEVEERELLKLAGVPEELIRGHLGEERLTWIRGRVAGRSGNLTEIDAGDWTLGIVEEPAKEEVRLGLRPEDITLFLTNEGFSGSSARNRIRGTVSEIENRDNYNLVELDCGSFQLKAAITDTSLEKMDLSPGKEVFATFKATAPVIREDKP